MKLNHEIERGKAKDMIKKSFILAIWICASTHPAVAKDFFLVKYAKSMKKKVFVLKAQKGVPRSAGHSRSSGNPVLDYYLTKTDLNEQPRGEGQYSVSG